MYFVWIILSLLAGYWICEWPRRAFSTGSRPIKRSQMENSRQRLSVTLFYLWIIVAGLLLTLAGVLLARHLAPGLWERFFVPWIMFLIHGGFGIAIGIFELVVGLSPGFYFVQNSGAEDRFFCDRARAHKVGTWRILSCSFVNAAVFVVSRVLD